MQVTLPCIGAEDIVDRNHRLILGLVWSIKHNSPADHHAEPTKIEDAQEIIPIQPPQPEVPGLRDLIEPVNQESLKHAQPSNSSLILVGEAVDVQEDKFLQHTTCVLQMKCNAAIPKNDIEIPIKCVKEADDMKKVQLLQQKDHEADEYIEASHQDLMKTKKGEFQEDEKPDKNIQIQPLKQNEIQHETIVYNNSENCSKQSVHEINEAGEFNKEQLLIEQEIEDVIKFNEEKDTESAKDFKIKQLELHLSVKEKHDQNGEPEIKELELKEAEDSYDKNEDEDYNREIELEAEVLNKMQLTEEKQKLDHQRILELDRYDEEEVCDLNKLIFNELKQNQFHKDEDSEIKQSYIEVDDEGFRTQKQESVERPQLDNGIEKTTQEGSSPIDCNDDSEYDSDYEAESGTNSTPFLHELLKECNRRGLIEKQREAKEKEKKEKRDIQFYKLLEQMSKDYRPAEPENEDIGIIFDEEKHKKEQLWKQREVERLQEEADRHREEFERQEKLKYDREEAERQKQLLMDD